MLGAIERRLGIKSSAEKSKSSAELERLKAQDRADRILLSIHSRLGVPARMLKVGLESEAGFIGEIQEIDKSVAERYSIPVSERDKHTRTVAYEAYSAINLQLSHPEPPEAPLVPVLVRSRRASLAWGLRRSEEITGDRYDMDWSLGVLGKGINGNLTEVDRESYINKPLVAVKGEGVSLGSVGDKISDGDLIYHLALTREGKVSSEVARQVGKLRKGKRVAKYELEEAMKEFATKKISGLTIDRQAYFARRMTAYASLRLIEEARRYENEYIAHMLVDSAVALTSYGLRNTEVLLGVQIEPSWEAQMVSDVASGQIDKYKIMPYIEKPLLLEKSEISDSFDF